MKRRATEELWRNTLSQIPSRLGQLIYLAGLRDPNTGVYAHLGLAQRTGSPEIADAAIRESHELVFKDWLCMAFVDQCDDCRLYWSGLMEDPQQVADMWRRTEGYRTWVPAEASAAQRYDFNAHLEILLDWITETDDAGGKDRGASQRP